MKTFLYVLITNFVFTQTDETVVKANVCVAVAFFLFSRWGTCRAEEVYDRVLTRPFIKNKFKEGSQCPMMVTPYLPEESTQ
jgi:hypothetical protein